MQGPSKPEPIDVYAIRTATPGVGETQKAFAGAIGVSVRTLSNWEQRRRTPTGPARALLLLLQRAPWLAVGGHPKA